MVQVQGRTILLRGEPEVLLAGEVHYFRLLRSEWEDRVLKAKAAGVQAIASYIPWIVHQEAEDELDLDGRLVPENDLGAFIDLCSSHDLGFIARPGPFIMAEMKNEGIPYWVYEKHPEASPVTWQGRAITSRTLDYLHEGYLKEAEKWYRAVLPLLASRSGSRGGPVWAIQLDNEIGMLSWVRNEPDLTPGVVASLRDLLGQGSSLSDDQLRMPPDDLAPAWREAHVKIQRARYSSYLQRLIQIAQEEGLGETPLFLNIHGTGGGRGTTFPVGISQLYQAMKIPGLCSGTDHYLGDVTRDNFQDLWLIDAFTQAATPGPLTSLEFEAGSGDYGDSGARRVGGDAADIKAKLSAVKGCRLINAYLIAGGRNRVLRHPRPDGSGRIAFTGERHGFAAPINPEGELGSTYPGLQATFHALSAASPILGSAVEQTDEVALGFIPDSYGTEAKLPGVMEEIVRGLERARPSLESLARGMLLAGFRPGAVDLQDPSQALPHCLSVGTSRLMAPQVQERLVNHVQGGGRLLMVGDLPCLDLQGRPSTLLLDQLGLAPGAWIESSDHYFASLVHSGPLAGRPEIRTGWLREVQGGDPFLHSREGTPCGVQASLGQGEAWAMACDYPSHAAAFALLLEAMGVKRRLALRCSDTGVFGTWSLGSGGGGALVLINLDTEPKWVQAEIPELFRLPSLTLGPKEARLLLFGSRLGGVEIAWSTLELSSRTPGALAFASGPGHVKARLAKGWHAEGGEVAEEEEGWTLFQVQPSHRLVFRGPA